MNIIEQAARRLEELQRSGVDITRRQGPLDGGTANGRDNHGRGAIDRAAGTVRRVGAAASGQTAGVSASRQVEIDIARLTAMGYVTPGNSREQVASEFRVIKRPLLMNTQGKSAAPVNRANLIMVTSSLPGEGKTFVAVNLAISIAMEMDYRVLLVDADVSRPAVLSRLGLPVSPGLLDLLTDPSLQLSDMLLRTNIERLSILPAGAPQEDATELLASEGMNRLLDELASRYSDRILVFDAPPLLLSTESRVLATRMGQVLVVVEADRTLQSSVMEAMATLDACPVVLPMLNKASRSEVGSYYGSYGPSQA